MPYIYKITNKLNQKIYIGKTVRTVKQRWEEHCREYQKSRAEHRPLYSAMNKYGIENFIVEEIEECSADILNEREKYWIEYYQSFKNGYNATIGGDGKQYIDYQQIYQYWIAGLSGREICKKLNIDKDTVKAALDNYHISHQDRVYQGKLSQAKMVKRIDKRGNILIFKSLKEAYLSVNKEKISSHIQEVCNHKRNSAYGYFWEWCDTDE